MVKSVVRKKYSPKRYETGKKGLSLARLKPHPQLQGGGLPAELFFMWLAMECS